MAAGLIGPAWEDTYPMLVPGLAALQRAQQRRLPRDVDLLLLLLLLFLCSPTPIPTALIIRSQNPPPLHPTRPSPDSHINRGFVSFIDSVNPKLHIFEGGGRTFTVLACHLGLVEFIHCGNKNILLRSVGTSMSMWLLVSDYGSWADAFSFSPPRDHHQ